MRRALYTLAGLLVLASGTAQSAVLLNEDFTGNSGGIPSGWSEYEVFSMTSGGTVVESGTTISLTDPAGGIPNYLSPGSYNPQGESTFMQVYISSLSGGGEALFGVTESTIDTFLVVRINESGDVSLLSSNNGPGAATVTTSLGTIAGYNGSALLDVAMTFDATGFSVTADGGSFNAGGSYASTIAGGFDLSEVGTTADLVLGINEGSGAYDSALFSVSGLGTLNTSGGGGGAESSTSVPVPAPLALFLAGLTFLRLRRHLFR